MIPDPAEQPTVPLWPTAGQAFGLGRARTFELARRGELPFPVYRLGRSFRCRRRRCGACSASARRAVAALKRRDGGGPRTPDATGLDTQTITAANGPTIIANPTARVVVDLDTWRWRPWPGWWGSREMACWSFAERSRRTA